jgi:WD40 repeat protein
MIDISYNSMKLWDMHSYECKWKLNNSAISIARLPNSLLVTFAHSGEIQLWNDNFELIKVITLKGCEGYRKKIFSLSNGNLACFALKDGRDRIIIVDCQTNTVVKTLDLQLGIINSIVSLSGNRFAACSDNGSINIWGMNDHKFLDYFGEDNWEIKDLLFIEKGNLLVEGTIISLGFWDVTYSPPRRVHRITGVDVNCLLLLPNGYFASASRNGNIKIWSLTTFHCINELFGSGYHTHSILLLKDHRIVTSSNSEISIWDY